MNVIWAPHFKVGSIIFFYNIGYHLEIQITLPLPEMNSLLPSRTALSSPLCLSLSLCMCAHTHAHTECAGAGRIALRP